MAAVVSLLGTATFNTTNGGAKTVTATPAVNDLIVIVTANTGTTLTNVNPTDNQTGGTYTLVNTAVKATSADTMQVWVRDNLITSATSTNFTQNITTTTGGGIVVLKITGMGKVGSAAIVQSAIQSNQASGGTPAPVLGATPKSYNPIIGAVFNASNIATLTPRTGYTEVADIGYNTPATGLEVMYDNSGETSATITWGSTSVSAFASIAVELNSTILNIANTSLSGAGTVSFVGSAKRYGLVSLTGQGTISPTPRLVKFVDASFNASLSYDILGIIKKLVNANLSSTASISSSYIWRQNYNGYRDTEDDNQRITEAGDFRITERFIDAQVALNSVGTLSADGTYIMGNQTYYGLASFTGTGTLSPVGIAKRYGAGSYSAAGTKTFTPTLKLKGASSFTGTGTESSTGRLFKGGFSNLTATGTISPTAKRTTYAIVNALANGTDIAAAERRVFGVIDLHGVHSGSFTPTLKLKPKFYGDGICTLSSTSTFKGKGQTSLTGTGTLTGQGYRIKIGASSLTASGTLTATAFDSTMYVRDLGTWKVSVPYVKDNNIWKRPLAIYKNQSGLWKRVS
jgi:hypothetical protein